MKLAGVKAGRQRDSHSCGQKKKGLPDWGVLRRRKGVCFFSGSLTLLFHMCCHALIDRRPLAMKRYEMPLSVGDTQRSVAICIIDVSAVCVALLIALLVLCDMLVQHLRCDRCPWEKCVGCLHASRSVIVCTWFAEHCGCDINCPVTFVFKCFCAKACLCLVVVGGGII